MIQCAEKIGVRQRHPKDRHLQTRKPDSDTRRDSVLLKNGLKHQGDDFNNGFFVLGFRLAHEFSGGSAQFNRDFGDSSRTEVFQNRVTPEMITHRSRLRRDCSGERG